jgi:hypothetical protein
MTQQISLDIYEYDEGNNQYLLISEGGLQSRPIQTTHDGTNGEVVESKLFLRNEDENFYYNNIRIMPTPDSKVRVGDINFPEANIGYKVIVKESQPTQSEWAATQSGDEAIIDLIGTTDQGDTSYKPFWVQVEIQPGTRIGAIRDVSLVLEADQNPVGG